MYSLNLSPENRILSATLPEYAPESHPRVEELPEGDISEYRYVDGVYIYDPLPEPEATTTPTDTERFEAQLLYTALMTDTLIVDTDE